MPPRSGAFNLVWPEALTTSDAGRVDPNVAHSGEEVEAHVRSISVSASERREATIVSAKALSNVRNIYLERADLPLLDEEATVEDPKMLPPRQRVPRLTRSRARTHRRSCDSNLPAYVGRPRCQAARIDQYSRTVVRVRVGGYVRRPGGALDRVHPEEAPRRRVVVART